MSKEEKFLIAQIPRSKSALAFEPGQILDCKKEQLTATHSDQQALIEEMASGSVSFHPFPPTMLAR